MFLLRTWEHPPGMDALVLKADAPPGLWLLRPPVCCGDTVAQNVDQFLHSYQHEAWEYEQLCISIQNMLSYVENADNSWCMNIELWHVSYTHIAIYQCIYIYYIYYVYKYMYI